MRAQQLVITLGCKHEYHKPCGSALQTLTLTLTRTLTRTLTLTLTLTRCILKWLKSCDAPSCPTCKAPVIVAPAPAAPAPAAGVSTADGAQRSASTADEQWWHT